MPYADKDRNREVIRRYHQDHPDEIKRNQKRWRQNVKRAALVAYSQDPPSCACCGMTGEVFLTLDHVDGLGAAERRARNHKGGIYTYREVKKAGYPPGYRVLCWNCNSAFYLLGCCPHQPADKPLKAPAGDVFAVTR